MHYPKENCVPGCRRLLYYRSESTRAGPASCSFNVGTPGMLHFYEAVVLGGRYCIF